MTTTRVSYACRTGPVGYTYSPSPSPSPSPLTANPSELRSTVLNMNAREIAVAAVAQEEAEWEAAEAAIGAGLARRSGRAMNSSSAVFSVRLDRGELRALETRAAALGIKPSVLARNLIRGGLRSPADLTVNDVVGRLVDAASELRNLLT